MLKAPWKEIMGSIERDMIWLLCIVALVCIGMQTNYTDNIKHNLTLSHDAAGKHGLSEANSWAVGKVY